MQPKVVVRLLVLASLLGIVGPEPLQCEEATANEPNNVTVSGLALHPRQYDGKLVRVEGLLALSWEGDNSISKPSPQGMPPDGQGYVWLYWKKYEHSVFGPILSLRHGSIYGSFTGYFHFVPKPHTVNGAFDPGPLQLDAIETSVPDTNRFSLAEAIRQDNVEEAREKLFILGPS